MKTGIWMLKKLNSEIEENVNCRNKSHFEQHCQWVQELPDVGGGDGQPQEDSSSHRCQDSPSFLICR